MKLSFHQAVRQEVEDSCQWYDEQRSGLGNEFFRELEKVFRLISANPRAFPLAPMDRRRAHLRRFPYVVHYRIPVDRVRVLAVHHDKRHPSYGTARK